MALMETDINNVGLKHNYTYQSYNDDQNNQYNFDGRRMRAKITTRKTVDYNCTFANLCQTRVFQRDYRDRPDAQPDPLYNFQALPPVYMIDKPVECLNTRPIRMAMNKVKCPIFTVKWTPEGRRLITGASSGEFTLWNGLTFSFETILQAHDAAVRAMVWSHSDQWMITADHNGFVKYWQSNMNNVKMYQIHKEPVRGLTFSPTDQKFASCSDDSTVRVWDFLTCAEKAILRGHGSDVRCVDWHPFNSLLLSGSRDTQQPLKMWDPRTSKSVTIHAHKNTVMDLKWNRNGKLFLTASRDHLVKLFDLRNLKSEVQTFKGHSKEATALSWHPYHEDLFVSGGSDGSIFFWLLDKKQEIYSISSAHDTMVWSLDWHPLGHILVSGSNDHTTKFWTRSRFGDQMRDRYNLNTLPAGVEDPDDVDATELDGSTSKNNANDKLHFFSSSGPIPFLELGDSIELPSLTEGVLSEINFDKVKEASLKAPKKTQHSKLVPHEFQRAWLEGRQPPTLNFQDPDLTIEETPYIPPKLPAPPHVSHFSHSEFYPDEEWGYGNHAHFRNFHSDFDFHPQSSSWDRGNFQRMNKPFRRHDNSHMNQQQSSSNNYYNENSNYHQNNNYNYSNFSNFNSDGYDNGERKQSSYGEQQQYSEQQQKYHDQDQQNFPAKNFGQQRHYPDQSPNQNFNQQKQHFNNYNDDHDDNYKSYSSYHHGNDNNRSRSRDYYNNQSNNRNEYRQRGRRRPYQRNR